jgi:uncharacterized membrane protein
MHLTKSSIYMTLLTMVTILLFSAISTYAPREYFWPISILYVIAYMSLAMLVPRLLSKKKAMEIKGSLILKAVPQEVMNLVSKDAELEKELKPQITAVILMSIIPLVIWFAFAGIIQSLLLQALINSNIHYMKFLGYVIFYSLLIGIIRVITYFITPKKMLMLINSYEIRSDGIKAGGFIITFPLDRQRYSMEINARRGFFEIYDKATRYAYRFYVSDMNKVKMVLEKYSRAR